MVRPNFPALKPDNTHSDPPARRYIDTLAFSLILFVAARSKVMKARIPSVLGTMAQDAALYFVLIFSSHFTLVMTMTLGRVSATVPPLPTTVNDIGRVSL